MRPAPSEDTRGSRPVFVTGPQRSGTTLVDRLLSDLPALTVLSQPLPLLFVAAKQRYLDDHAVREIYPLDPLFPPGRPPDDFVEFLATFRPSREWLEDTLSAMSGYSGQYTPVPPGLASDVAPNGTFADILEELVRRLTPGQRGGLKETVCEEYVPLLAAHGWATIICVRDPRDVLASLNHGDHHGHAGRLKPTLYNVRQWRKGAAYAISTGTPPCLMLRYEDLVREPSTTLARVARDIGSPAEAGDIDAAVTRVAATWSGNSSAGPRTGISTDSIGRHEALLPDTVRRFVEAACLPELRRLGYAVDMSIDEALDTLAAFRDPYPCERAEFEGYADSSGGLEQARLLGLTGRADVPDALYVRAGVREQLAGALR